MAAIAGENILGWIWDVITMIKSLHAAIFFVIFYVIEFSAGISLLAAFLSSLGCLGILILLSFAMM